VPTRIMLGSAGSIDSAGKPSIDQIRHSEPFACHPERERRISILPQGRLREESGGLRDLRPFTSFRVTLDGVFQQNVYFLHAAYNGSRSTKAR
jgi:hypothetical protein